MTAAEYQAQHGKKPVSRPATPRTPPVRHNPAPEPVALATGPKIPPAHFAYDNGAATWVVGPHASISLAARHDPTRQRIVYCGPADAELLRVLMEAIKEYFTHSGAQPHPNA